MSANNDNGKNYNLVTIRECEIKMEHIESTVKTISDRLFAIAIMVAGTFLGMMFNIAMRLWK